MMAHPSPQAALDCSSSRLGGVARVGADDGLGDEGEAATVAMPAAEGRVQRLRRALRATTGEDVAGCMLEARAMVEAGAMERIDVLGAIVEGMADRDSAGRVLAGWCLQAAKSRKAKKR